MLNCLACDHGPVCLLCIINYIPDPKNAYRTCIACPNGHYSLNNLCYPCALDISKCLACYHTGNELNCTVCDKTAVIDPETFACFNCAKITPFCFDCQDTNICTVCKYPYILGPSGICDVCESGFERLGGLCIKPIGCQNSVPDYSKCIGCFPQYNYIYDEKSKSCICKLGYLLTKVNESSVCLNKCGNGITSIPD